MGNDKDKQDAEEQDEDEHNRGDEEDQVEEADEGKDREGEVEEDEEEGDGEGEEGGEKAREHSDARGKENADKDEQEQEKENDEKADHKKGICDKGREDREAMKQRVAANNQEGARRSWRVGEMHYNEEEERSIDSGEEKRTAGEGTRKEESGLLREAKPTNARLRKTVRTSAACPTEVRVTVSQLSMTGLTEHLRWDNSTTVDIGARVHDCLSQCHAGDCPSKQCDAWARGHGDCRLGCCAEGQHYQFAPA